MSLLNETSFEEEAFKYLQELLVDLEEVELGILKLAERETFRATLSKIGRVVHSIKGTAGSYGFDLLSVTCHKMEDKFLSSDVVKSDVLVDELLGLKDVMVRLCKAYRAKDSKSLDSIKADLGVYSPELPTLVSSLPGGPIADTPVRPHVGKFRVLLAENSKLLSDTLIRELNEFEVEISVARDGYDVLGRMLHERFDLVVTSLYMPTIDAISLFKILAIIPSPNPDVKLVVMTSSKEKAAKIQKKDLVILEKGADFGLKFREALVNCHLPKKQAPRIGLAARQSKIVIVDDSEDVHFLVGVSLKKFPNVELIHCLQPSLAEDQIAKERPDMVLLDVQMPEVSGEELIQRLKKNPETKDIPVVFLTGTDIPAELKRLALLGAKGIILKPFSPKNLMEKLSEIFDRTQE